MAILHDSKSLEGLSGVERQLKNVQSELARKVLVCARELQVQDVSSNVHVLEKTVAEASSVFELVQEEAESIRNVKAKLDKAKAALGGEVSVYRQILAVTLDKVKGNVRYDGSEDETDILILQAKVEGAQSQLHRAFQSIQELDRLEKELEVALLELLPVLTMHQQKLIRRITRSKLESQDLQEFGVSTDGKSVSELFDALPATKESAEIQVLRESIMQICHERDTLKEELSTRGPSNSEMISELEKQVSLLKSELERVQREGEEKRIPVTVQQQKKKVVTSDDEDSYGFDDDDTVDSYEYVMPEDNARLVELYDTELEAELDDMPVSQPILRDHLRHEEELEEYAVQVLSLKETIAELQEENKQLQAKIASSSEVSEHSHEMSQAIISDLESEVDKLSSSQGAEILREEVERYQEEIALLKKNAQITEKKHEEHTLMLQKRINRLKVTTEQDKMKSRNLVQEMQEIVARLESEEGKKQEMIESLTRQLRDSKKELNNRWNINMMQYDYD